jgi:drug/metabolite transporter (DMT)-like permease
MIGAAILAAISETVLWTMNESYGRFIDNGNALGVGTFFFHCPGMLVAGLFGLKPPQDTPIIVASGGIQFFLIYWAALGVLLRLASRQTAEPNASPNGGPTELLGNSDARGGPPSVS